MIEMKSDRFKIRKARVLNNGETAGYLLTNKRRFVFIYDSDYIANGGNSIAIGFPKKQRIFSSRHLFPFFSGLLPEGENLAYTCRCLKLDPTDKFNLLQELAQHETIGAITVQKMTAEKTHIAHIPHKQEISNTQNLGEQIAQRRKYFKLSQLDLAEMSGVSPRTVSAIEKGKANPRLSVLSKILETVGLVIALQERVIYE